MRQASCRDEEEVEEAVKATGRHAAVEVEGEFGGGGGGGDLR